MRRVRERVIKAGWDRGDMLKHLHKGRQRVIQATEPAPPPTETPQPEALVAAAQVRGGVRACLSSLTEREALIVRLRYGLDTDEPHSLQDIGDVLGLSRERVRQLEKQTFTKLRQLPQSAELAELAR